MTSTRQPPDIAALKNQFRRGGAMLWLGVTMTGGAVLQLLWFALRRTLGVVFALIVLFEQWGWRPLAAALQTIAHVAPIAALERRISRLPPYAALVTFALPTVLLVPLKLFALYLIANGHAFSAGGLFIGAKIDDAFLPDLTARKKFAASRVPRLADIALDELLSLQPSRLAKF